MNPIIPLIFSILIVIAALLRYTIQLYRLTKFEALQLILGHSVIAILVVYIAFH